MPDPSLEALRRASAHAFDYLEGLDTRSVASTATLEELRARLGVTLGERGVAPELVIDELVAATEGGHLGSAGGRFFAWVMGGALPAALAADWLASTWDNNAALHACGPAAAVVEEVAGAWLKDILDLPAQASFAFTTGCQLAHLTCLAAARHALLDRVGWDVETEGLAGAPAIRVLTTDQHHASLARALRLLGIGTRAVVRMATDAHKWLNTPYDAGLAFVRDSAAHRAAMTTTASYLVAGGDARDQIDWNPEWSRRARGFPVYAALRELGRLGVEDLVDRCCSHALAIARGLAALPGVVLVAEPTLNQGLVRFLDPRPQADEADHDRRTDAVIAAVNAGGEAFFSGTSWRGRRAMRISVVNWRTSADDVRRTVAAVAGALA